MSNYSSRLLVIKNKVGALLDENAVLKSDKNQLNSTNLALQTELEAAKAQIQELQEKMQMLKLAKSIGTEETKEEKTDLKRKINEYIKEIDRCIALLNE